MMLVVIFWTWSPAIDARVEYFLLELDKVSFSRELGRDMFIFISRNRMGLGSRFV